LTWDGAPGSPATRAELSRLPVRSLARGAVLFRPGEGAEAFPLVLAGRVEVHLTGPSGREIMLYAVEPGQTCVQTTLGLLGDELYGAEAIVTNPSRVVLVPRATFLRLMDEDAAFRLYVLRAFGLRMAEVTRLLERVAFGRIETRLAEIILVLAVDGVVTATQAELAARIGTAREVVTRKLEALVRSGLVATDRGSLTVLDPDGLRQLAARDM
jgi:CRP/FNR family transcriptional regulator, anaerobic regulatory protein